MGVDTVFSDNKTLSMANTSTVDDTGYGGLLEGNLCTDDTNCDLIFPEQLKLTESISKAMPNELVPDCRSWSNRSQTKHTERFEGRN